MNGEILDGYIQTFKQLGEVQDKQNMSIDDLLDEWHKTKNIGTAHDICERLWRMAHNGEDEDGEET